jgi:phosphohistidine phosphatase
VAILYLLRHAKALSPAEAKVRRDEERPLSAEGRVRMERAAQGMKRAGIVFEWILTSPFVRARETAEIVAAAMGVDAEHLVVDRALSSGAAWKSVRKALAEYDGAASVLCVGHQPDLSSIAGEILRSSHEAVEFGTGTLAGIGCERMPPGEGATLRLLLTIDQLERMAG